MFRFGLKRHGLFKVFAAYVLLVMLMSLSNFQFSSDEHLEKSKVRSKEQPQSPESPAVDNIFCGYQV